MGKILDTLRKGINHDEAADLLNYGNGEYAEQHYNIDLMCEMAKEEADAGIFLRRDKILSDPNFMANKPEHERMLAAYKLAITSRKLID